MEAAVSQLWTDGPDVRDEDVAWPSPRVEPHQYARHRRPRRIQAAA